MMRILSSLLLALVLALTSQSMAVARGANAATGQMVLCTGAGPMAVYVDANGQPTSAPHICPDSALNVIFAGVSAIGVIPVRVIAFVPTAVLSQQVIPALPAALPPSRAPPLTA